MEITRCVWLLYFLLSNLQNLNTVCADNAYERKCHITEECSSTLSCLNESFPGNVTDNQVVKFNSSLYCLNTIIFYSNIKNIQFIGADKFTSIQCVESAGLKFNLVNGLSLIRLSFNNCAFDSMQTPSVFVGIYILNSQHITINGLAISHSPGTGMIIADSYGVISVSNSRFQNNKANVTRSGGGMYIDFSLSTSNSWAEYSLSGCEFFDNSAKDLNFVDQGVGGGMGIALRHNSTNVSLTITGSSFHGNSGAGLRVLISHSTHNVSLRVVNTTFESNRAEHDDSGGGGVDIAFSNFSRGSPPNHNELYFENVTIMNNAGEYGGGMQIYSDYAPQDIFNHVKFHNCSWLRNEGRYGSAIDISSIQSNLPLFDDGILPSVFFHNCIFENNSYYTNILLNQKQAPNNSEVYQIGCATVLVTHFKVDFSGETHFIGNQNSAIYATSSIINVNDNSSINFTAKFGQQGDAVALVDSKIKISGDCVWMVFTNSSKFNGGVIHWEAVDFLGKKSCFIQTIIKSTSLEFPNKTCGICDTLSGYKKYILLYVASLHCPNFSLYNNNTNTYTNDWRMFIDQLGCTATLSSSEGSLSSSEIAKFILKKNVKLPFEAVPGFDLSFPFEIKDEFSQLIRPSHYTYSTKSNIEMQFYPKNKIRLHGKPGNHAQMQIVAHGINGLAISFNITLLECPPFFNFNNTEQRCECTRYIRYYFAGIKYCEADGAFIEHGFWIGYAGSATENDLILGYCPTNHCFQQSNLSSRFRYHRLPIRADKEKLDRLVCGEAKRTNVFCSRCVEGYTVYFHSDTFKCGSEATCKWGFLLYLLSELLPLTTFFIFILLFNIKFTSGELNGFIFFAQVSDVIGDFGISFLNSHIFFTQMKYNAVYNLVYKAFNFGFFSIDALSFCLYKGARTIDIIAFKYISVVYGLILFILVILCLKYCKCKYKCNKIKVTNMSIIHGLTTFFVLEYAQCMKVTFLILNPGYLYDSNESHRIVVYHQGDMDYLKGKHLLYAFPAVFSLIVINLALPTLLVSYPLSNRIVAFFKLDRFATIRCIARNIPIIKLKPLIDSFQGSFKDKYRFFSGLYFFYRILILLPRFLIGFLGTYIIFQIQFLFMMVIHVLVWPYKKYWHNVLDTSLFLNLSIINSLNIFIYVYSREGFIDPSEMKVAYSLRLILLYLPIVYLAIRFISVIALKIFKCRQISSHPTESVPHVTSSDENEEGSSESWTSSSLNFNDSYRLVQEKKIKMHGL